MRVADPKACQCGEVLKGVIKPWECKVFGTACTPETRSAPAWSRPRVRAPRTTPTAASRASARWCEHGRDPSVSEREQRVLDIIAKQRARRPKLRDAHITMAHGAGGKATQTLIEGVLVPAFGSPALDALADVATIEAGGARLAFTTDSFVVKPIRFPGGSIGELAVNGTVNDLAVGGARPLALSLAMVLEEGLSTDVLREEIEAIALAAAAAGVQIVCGDTKVVERGHADSMYLCTTGIGLVDERAASRLASRGGRPRDRLGLDRRARDGDHARARRVRPRRRRRVRHAPAVACGRCAARRRGGAPALPARRHARRGARANELARASEAAIVVRERDIPVLPAVAGAAEILGIDPLYIANDGTFVAFVAPRGRMPRWPHCARSRVRGRSCDRRGQVVAGRDGADGNRVRRQAGGRPAGRRPAAADLLIEPGS